MAIRAFSGTLSIRKANTVACSIDVPVDVRQAPLWRRENGASLLAASLASNLTNSALEVANKPRIRTVAVHRRSRHSQPLRNPIAHPTQTRTLNLLFAGSGQEDERHEARFRMEAGAGGRVQGRENMMRSYPTLFLCVYVPLPDSRSEDASTDAQTCRDRCRCRDGLTLSSLERHKQHCELGW
ncbi:hypothetical protein A0H81_00165 [Grifola frondosa]|uniref:Uncharacterized protein n=1 Tax=Grifola frondosa TaxID=5627 RepID=A0A1C7MSZ5_GRIFR|nr:hypothetical protein A0H81_00165 [Grifola frondosa]